MSFQAITVPVKEYLNDSDQLQVVHVKLSGGLEHTYGIICDPAVRTVCHSIQEAVLLHQYREQNGNNLDAPFSFASFGYEQDTYLEQYLVRKTQELATK